MLFSETFAKYQVTVTCPQLWYYTKMKNFCDEHFQYNDYYVDTYGWTHNVNVYFKNEEDMNYFKLMFHGRKNIVNN